MHKKKLLQLFIINLIIMNENENLKIKPYYLSHPSKKNSSDV